MKNGCVGINSGGGGFIKYENESIDENVRIIFLKGY
jgi:hypothetical protein